MSKGKCEYCGIYAELKSGFDGHGPYLCERCLKIDDRNVLIAFGMSILGIVIITLLVGFFVYLGNGGTSYDKFCLRNLAHETCEDEQLNFIKYDSSPFFASFKTSLCGNKINGTGVQNVLIKFSKDELERCKK